MVLVSVSLGSQVLQHLLILSLFQVWQIFVVHVNIHWSLTSRSFKTFLMNRLIEFCWLFMIWTTFCCRWRMREKTRIWEKPMVICFSFSRRTCYTQSYHHLLEISLAHLHLRRCLSQKYVWISYLFIGDLWFPMYLYSKLTKVLQCIFTLKFTLLPNFVASSGEKFRHWLVLCIATNILPNLMLPVARVTLHKLVKAKTLADDVFTNNMYCNMCICCSTAEHLALPCFHESCRDIRLDCSVIASLV